MSVVIETTQGDITVDLFLTERPKACLNFIKLCKLKYYNFNLFHTVERNFIAQTGDPTGLGDGGESVWGVIEGPDKKFFEAEFLPKIRHTHPGLLSFVSVGKNMIGSQFFFTLGSELTSLDGLHCVIGEVVEGHEVLRKLNETIVDDKFKPYQDVRITHTVILEDPFNDPRGFKVPDRSPSPTPERLKNGKIGADEDIDDTEGKTAAEIQEMLAEREAKARATILEIVGDLPDAECAPPENVLFVCKLNPVTNDDDLEIIFSRFGKVVNCEVIRDKQTGDSLQYAFVEFEDQKSCENAYFKMDNVLIDDRRIHVDFSQSVSRVKWKGKGRGVETSGKLDFNNLQDDGKRNHNGRSRDRSLQRDRSQRNQSNGSFQRRYAREGRSPERNRGRRSPQRQNSRHRSSQEKRIQSNRSPPRREGRNDRSPPMRQGRDDRSDQGRIQMERSRNRCPQRREDRSDYRNNHNYRGRSDRRSPQRREDNRDRRSPQRREDRRDRRSPQRREDNRNQRSPQGRDDRRDRRSPQRREDNRHRKSPQRNEDRRRDDRSIDSRSVDNGRDLFRKDDEKVVEKSKRDKKKKSKKRRSSSSSSSTSSSSSSSSSDSDSTPKKKKKKRKSKKDKKSKSKRRKSSSSDSSP